MDFSAMFLAGGVLFGVVGCWFGFHYLANPPMPDPDGTAKILGNCGDTMEISLQIKDGVITRANYWSDGCSVSKQCVEAAGILAQGKSVEDASKITMIDVMELAGELPESHLHCAQLAETTLRHAIDNYRDTGKKE